MKLKFLSTLAISALALAPASMVMADDDSPGGESSAVAQLNGLGQQGGRIKYEPRHDYDNGKEVAQLFKLVVDGVEYEAYCIELGVIAAANGTADVTGWDGFIGDNKFKDNPDVQQKVAWIVANSYPSNSVEAVGEAAGISGLTEAEAIRATQAAI